MEYRSDPLATRLPIRAFSGRVESGFPSVNATKPECWSIAHESESGGRAQKLNLCLRSHAMRHRVKNLNSARLPNMVTFRPAQKLSAIFNSLISRSSFGTDFIFRMP